MVTGFAVHAVTAVDGHIQLTAADGRTVTADRIIAATGFRPDHRIATELRLDLDPVLGCTRALAPLIDPNDHSCGTVRPHGVDELTQPEPGYFAVGMKSYGRAPTFLMATGYEQVRSIAAALAGDWVAARDVQLDLPETGVCSATPSVDLPRAELGLVTVSAGGNCCGGDQPPHYPAEPERSFRRPGPRRSQLPESGRPDPPPDRYRRGIRVWGCGRAADRGTHGRRNPEVGRRWISRRGPRPRRRASVRRPRRRCPGVRVGGPARRRC